MKTNDEEENILDLINGPSPAERELANQVSLLVVKRLMHEYNEKARIALYSYMKNSVKGGRQR